MHVQFVDSDFYQLGARPTGTKITLPSCVCVCVCVCSSAIITYAKLRHLVTIPLYPRAQWKLLEACRLSRPS